MKRVDLLRVGAVAAAVLGATLWTACADHPAEVLGGPEARVQGARPNLQRVRAALAAQERHTPALMRLRGVIGTAVGLMPDGEPGVQVLLENAGVQGIPAAVDGVPVATRVTGRFLAFSDPTGKARPAPLGFSVGHPAITAGSIGARVTDGSGKVYVLSNNHVLANSNDATIGDPEYQPGPYDGGTAADQFATLSAFQPINFSGGNNTIDAAIALTSTADLSNASPTSDGYGTPNSQIFGDANHDGLFDDENALLGLTVQKYGRTTGLTQGQITGINATVDVCYEVWYIFCLKSAHYVDQLIISPGTFSGGGDSGSLIVTDDGDKNPVGLLFAGSSNETIANRIDLVLTHFGVSVDGGAPAPPPPPPSPVTDLAVTGVSAPSSVTQGATVNVVVSVQNVGNQPVAGVFDVTLNDATDNVLIGTRSVSGLAAGASVNLTFAWNTAGRSLGTHALVGRQGLTDDNGANDEAQTTTMVNAPSVQIHIGDLDGSASRNGNRWSATVQITVHDQNHNPINGATVVGTWNPNSFLSANTCTTGDLGGNGTCIVLLPAIARSRTSVTFTVNSVTAPGKTYGATQNHDPDGDSNGTTIRVYRP